MSGFSSGTTWTRRWLICARSATGTGIMTGGASTVATAATRRTNCGKRSRDSSTWSMPPGPTSQTPEIPHKTSPRRHIAPDQSSPGSYLDGDEARIERLLQQIHLQFLSRTRQPQRQACVPAGRLDQFHLISRSLEGIPDMSCALRQRRVIPRGEIQILGRATQDLMSPEGIATRQQQAVAFEDGQAIKQHSQVSGGQPLKAHRQAVVISFRSHSLRACGPRSRRKRGHMLTSDSRCTNRSRSSRCASASSSAYKTRRWSSSPTSYTRRPDQATCNGNSTRPVACPLRSSREDGTRRSYPAQRDGKAPSSIRPIILP